MPVQCDKDVIIREIVGTCTGSLFGYRGPCLNTPINTSLPQSYIFIKQ